MDQIKKKKLKLILFSLIYVGLSAAIIVSGFSIFNNFYYEMVYVSGVSMNPTLSGVPGNADYGKTDKTMGAKRALKRYQIVTTFFPGEDPYDRKTSYKIKRVIGLPGETIKVVDNNLYVYNKAKATWGESLEMPFLRTGIDVNDAGEKLDEPTEHQNQPEITLGKDEFFLAGDNWAHSYDSFEVGPIAISSLVGVVTSIEGRCNVENGKVVSLRPYDKPLYFLGVDY